MPKTLVTLYSTPAGATERFTDRQLMALQRASGVWQSLGYKFLYYGYDVPTYSDRQIADMLGDYLGMVHIGVLAPEYRDPALPYIVTARHGDTGFAPAATFREALKSASELFLSDVATVAQCDFRPEFRPMAEEFRIVLLVV
jgi:hypothetical protein